MGDDRGETTAARPAAPADEVVIRLFAAARDAIGVRELRVAAGAVGTVGRLIDSLAERSPEASRVLPVCTVMVGGRRGEPDDPVRAGDVVEVLPPFAGG